MGDFINNVAAADSYTPACTIGPNYEARSCVITVANNPALMQFAIGKLGDWRWTDEREFFSIPQSFQVGNVIGVKLRNANPGQVARILAVLSGDDDPAFQSGVPFSGVLQASGAITPAATLLDNARLKVSGTPSLVSGTHTPLQLVQAYDFNTSVAIFPTRAGVGSGFLVNAGGTYDVTATVVFAQNATGDRYLWIRQNGLTTLSELQNVRPAASVSIQTICQVVGQAVLAAGDYLELMAFQSSGGGLTVAGGSLAMEKIQ